MKGLLLKDFYMMIKYCRSYVFMTVLFLAMSLYEQLPFFLFYPCVFCGMIPSTLLAYDERNRWLQYSGTLPYTKGQIVSGKYLIGLMMQAAMLILTGIVHGVAMRLRGAFSLSEFATIMMMIPVMSMIPSAISMPFMFKYGVEKGRLSYYFMIGVSCAMCVMGAKLLDGGVQMNLQMSVLLPILCVVVAGIYALSWYLAIVFFNKREVV